MTTGTLNGVIQQLRTAALPRDLTGLADGQLLERFALQRDPDAFEVLVRRHAAMVWGVCQRVLRHREEAEDAFQATFLDLVRKAASVLPREAVANWLFGVAYRTALKARGVAARRNGHERQVSDMPEPEAAPQELWADVQAVLDQELSHLPDRYRLPLVLCELEGKSHKEAAAQLGWKEGTLAGRLSRARALLAKRLTRRGVVLTAGLLSAVLAEKAAVAAPAAVVRATVRAGRLLAAGGALRGGVVSAQVAGLTEGVLKSMLLVKLKMATAVVLGRRLESRWEIG
jgi:RNA polymerase sigma factor (sigma-70 family)